MSKRRQGFKPCRRSLFKYVISTLVNVNNKAIIEFYRKFTQNILP